ncbi:F-box only protein 47-like [Oppia nitens]|uniref:F-box only protein 47-like n=1 Tax=Oppia nitens TaxID=1686743 RepID=UPI0023DBA93B|nr:F-box only protein 47-like [Oppia nitens]
MNSLPKETIYSSRVLSKHHNSSHVNGVKKFISNSCPISTNTSECLKTWMSSMCCSQPVISLCRICANIDCKDTCITHNKTYSGDFHCLPNEAIAVILSNLNFDDLSLMAITNKWFRDFILNHFIVSNSGFQTLIGSLNTEVISLNTDPQHNCQPLESFKKLGLLLKRVTCLLPTTDRMELLIKVMDKLNGIPNLSINAADNYKMKYVFKCLGQTLHKMIAGWDDSEVKFVYKILQAVTHMDQRIESLAKSPIGARQPVEYYVRCYYRHVCLIPILRNKKLSYWIANNSNNISETLFWLNLILKPYSLEMRARLLLIIYGPIIDVGPQQNTIPYIGWWDLTDTFFIMKKGIRNLGNILFVLFRQSQTDEHKNNMIKLIDIIVKKPQNWLHENIATLLFFAGDDLIYYYLMSKMSADSYTEVAENLVYLTHIHYKITNTTNLVFKLIERLAIGQHKFNLINELPIAFNEAVADIDGAIELEDERDVTELHEIIAAQSDLLKNSLQVSLGLDSNESQTSPISTSILSINNGIRESLNKEE